MKSKPPLKKARLDTPTSSSGLDGLSSSSGRSGANASPSGSTTSSVSSLLSIPPTSSAGGSRSAAASDNAAKSTTGSSSVIMRSAGPSYPTYGHTDATEFPRINVLVTCAKEGKPVTLGPEGTMTMDDIDCLQGELETIWSAMATRMRSLKLEQAVLQNSSSSVNVTAVLGEHFDPHHQEKINAVASLIDAGHGTRTSVSAAAKLVMGGTSIGSPSASAITPGSSGTIPVSKKTAAAVNRQDKLPKKKLKGDATGTLKKGGEKPARATQNRSHSVSSDFGGLDSFYNKHEAPNEFWQFADDYCSEILPSHLEDLHTVIEEHNGFSESLFDIPSLGKHFKDGEDSSKTRSSELKQPRRIDACGPLTQRLVSALVDERVQMYHSQRNHGLGSPREDVSNNGGNSASATGELGFIHRAGLIKALGLDSAPNRPPMENQVRDCLLDRGLLQLEDSNDPLLFNPEDEILGEIKRTQNTLKKLHQYNKDKLGDLLHKAQRELQRASLKDELEKVDKDVIEAYKAIASMKQKKKPVTKKERDTAVKALEDRDRVLIQLSPSLKSESAGPATMLKIEV